MIIFPSPAFLLPVFTTSVDIILTPGIQAKNLKVISYSFVLTFIANMLSNSSDFAGEAMKTLFSITPRVCLGSIMICRARAIEQATEYGHSIEREMGFLTCHGLLHLLGFDHIKEEDEKVMMPLQKEIMDTIGLTR